MSELTTATKVAPTSTATARQTAFGRPEEQPGAKASRMRTRPMRITIVDRHALLVDSLGMVLERQGYLVTRVHAEPQDSSVPAILAAALRSAGRLVLLEPRLGRVGDGTRLIAPLTASGATVVVLTETADPVAWGEAVRQGAKEVLPKTCSLGTVVTTVQKVRDGLPLMTAEQRRALVEAAQAEREELHALRARFDRLTRREQEVMAALMDGALVRDIARTSFVSEATVRSQVKSILAKLDLGSQVAAVGAAHRVGWRRQIA